MAPNADHPSGLGSRGMVEVEPFTKAADSPNRTAAVKIDDVVADGWAGSRLERLQRNARTSVSATDPAQCLADLAEVVDRAFLKRLFVEIAEHLKAHR